LDGIQAIEATMAGSTGNLGRATLDLDVDERTFSSSLKRAEGNAQGFVGRLTGILGKIGLAAIGIQAVTKAIVGLGKAMMGPIMAASDMNESVNKANVVFGKSIGLIDQFAATSAQAFGQSKQAAYEMTATFGNMFTSMGFGRKEAAVFAVDISKLASDLASFNNIPVAEALEKIRAGLVGETEPLRSLGVTLSAVKIEQEAISKGWGKWVKKGKKAVWVMNDAEKATATYSLIMKGTANAQGDFANTADGMANALRIIDASFEDAMVTIGEQFLPTIAPLIAAFSRGLPDALKSVTPLLKTLGQAFQGIVELIMGQGWTNLYLGIQNLFGSDTAYKIREIVVALGGFATTVKEAIASGDFSKVWESIKGLGAGLLAKLGEAVAGINWGAVWDYAKGVAASVTTWLGEQWSKIGWGTVWASAKGVATDLAKKLPDIAASVVAWLVAQWPTEARWTEVWNSATTMGAGLVKSVLAIGADVVAWLVKQWPTQEQWTSIWNSATTMGAALIASTLAIGAAVLAWLKLQWPTQTQWTEIWDSATTMGAGLVASVLNIAASVTTWLTTQWKAVNWAAVWAGAQDAMSIGLGTILLKTDPSVFLALQSLTTAYSSVKTAINDVITAVQSVNIYLNEHKGVMFILVFVVGFLAGLVAILGAAYVIAGASLLAMNIITIAGAVATGIYSAAAFIAGVATALWAAPLILIIATLAGLALALIWAYNNVDWFREAVDTVAAVVRDLFNVILAAAKKQLDDMGKALSAVASFLSGAFDKAVVAAHKVVDGLEYGFSLVSKTVSTVIDTIKTLIDKLGDIKMPAILQTIANKASEVAGLIGGIRIPGYASGTSFAPGGMAIVGEYGPELVNLPRGSQVIPNGETMRALQGAAGVVNNYNLNANYRNTETEMSLRQTIRMLQMADGRR
jgi:hypothetical protein